MSGRPEKLEAAVKKLATDMGEVRGVLKTHGKQLTELGAAVAEIAVSVKEIQRTQLALTNGMTLAIKQLGADKSLEVRMQRVEEAVFGSKH